jgi:hypothetical protein
MLERLRVWICLHHNGAAGSVTDLILVQLAARQPGNEELPYAAGSVGSHRVHATVPVVELPDDADTLRVGGPYRESYSGYPIALLRVAKALRRPRTTFAMFEKADQSRNRMEAA